MNNPTQGTYTVVGMVTGTHVIEDLKLPVPYRVAVHIPADEAHRSRDLWIGIDQKRLFLLKGQSGAVRPAPKATPVSVPAASKEEVDQLKSELEAAKQELVSARQEAEKARQDFLLVQGRLTDALTELAAAQKHNSSLQEDHTKKLETIVGMLSRLGSGQVSVVEGVQEALQAVGGDIPVFIPDTIQPQDAETNIQTKKVDVLEGSTVKGAASSLRELKKGRAKGKPA